MAISSDVVRIVIRGAPQPYRERSGVATRKLPDGSRAPIIKNGKPVVWSYRPDHVRTYQDHLRRAAEDAMAGRPLFTGPLCVTVRAFMPIPKTTLRVAQRKLAERELLPHTTIPDLDNIIKACNDAGQDRIWKDDKQIAIYRDCVKVYSPQPRLEIDVRAVTTIADVAIAEEDEGTPFTRFVQEALL